jgi:hypothetical protein
VQFRFLSPLLIPAQVPGLRPAQWGAQLLRLFLLPILAAARRLIFQGIRQRLCGWGLRPVDV